MKIPAALLLIGALLHAVTGLRAEPAPPLDPTPPAPIRIPPPALQAKVKGLLVVALRDGTHAGVASQMNATAILADDPSAFDLRFNQQVGPQMTGATAEVAKLMQVRHPEKLPKGYLIEFGFANKFNPKDGPSAAVACGLMAESIITGQALDQRLAVTGDMTASGDIRPVGGVIAKIKSASRTNTDLFCVPAANIMAVSDLYVSRGLKAITEIQIIAVKDFGQVLPIALAKKPPAIAAALADFELVKTSVLRNPLNAGHPKVQEKLKAILNILPHHESARLIALHGQRRGPTKLSLIGSLNIINSTATAFRDVLRDGDFTSVTLTNPLLESVSALRKIEKRLDDRTLPYLKAHLRIGEYVIDNKERQRFLPSEIAEFKSLFQNLRDQRTQLSQDPELQGEILDSQ